MSAPVSDLAVQKLGYPVRALIGDYLRSGLGIVLTLPPALAVPLGSVAQYVLAALVVLFATFGARTLIRQSSTVAIEPGGVTVSALRRTRLEWARLRSVKLNYYSTRGDRGEGWMQLTLKGTGGPDGGTIRVDSSLDGFVEVARAGHGAAKSQIGKSQIGKSQIGTSPTGTAGLQPLSETTRVNFASLGIAIDEPEPAAEGASSDGPSRGGAAGRPA
jgi:hypothetical protein